jgi:hypothetical protein
MKLDCNSKELGKYTDFIQDEIREYLKELKKLVLGNQYIISKRDENDAFIYDYRIDSNKEKEILLNLKYMDFCYAAANIKPGYEHERLYIFCKEYELDNWGDLETVEIYIKTNMNKTRSGIGFIAVISFHKLNKPISYLFI